MDAAKSFELEKRAGYSRLALHPNLNAFRWEDVERSAAGILGELEATRAPAVVVDLSPLDYLGSAQLTLLVRIWKMIKSRDGKMVVHVHGPVVREVINTAGLNSLWELADSHESACQMLGLHSDGGPSASLLSPIIGLVAAAGAAAILAISMVRSELIDSKVALAGVLGCSGVALIAGLWTVMRGTGARRALGAALVVGSAILAVAGVFNNRPATAENKPTEQPAEESKASDSKAPDKAPSAGKAAPQGKAASENSEEEPQLNPAMIEQRKAEELKRAQEESENK